MRLRNGVSTAINLAVPFNTAGFAGLLLLFSHFTHAAPEAEMVADLLELFPNATVTNSSSAEIRRPTSAGGVKQDALFEHPSPGRPARVEFRIALPTLNAGEQLLLGFETALADGITMSAGVDGVRFTVEVDGKKIFEESRREMRWMPHLIDLAGFAGQMVNLALITDEIANSTYDWAVWGTPRVIKVSGKVQNARDLVFPATLQLLKLGPSRAVISAGDTATILAEVKNVGYGPLPEGEAQVHLRGVSPRSVPALSPGESWLAEWTLPQAESMELVAEVGTNALKSRLEVSRPVTTNTIQNELVRIDFVRESDGYSFARLFGRRNKHWIEVGIWKPLFGLQDWTVRPLAPRSHTKSSIEFVQPALDLDGVEWQVSVRVKLDRERPTARIHYEWQARKPRPGTVLWGPNIYVGQGAAKSWGLFPGLEYLYGPERSSNPRDFAPPLHDRRTPEPHKITIPVMAVTVGPHGVPASAGSRFYTPDSLMDYVDRVDAVDRQHTVSLHWPPGNISTRFASPNFDENMDNHRLGLFTTNATTLDATLVIAKGPVLVAAREWLRDTGGLPKPNPWPRSFHDELDLCRVGFLKTVSDDKGEKFRHCIGWGASHAPGFAALLWLDSRIATNRDSAARVDVVATNMLREGGPGALVSQANCHIMQWEFPFLYGHLPEAISHLDGFIAGLIKSQRPDGGWVYEPANKEQADLGRAGDSVLGTCANRASSLLRYARITGHTAALAAGEKALSFMEMFRVPRGGQTWECPMYEPDVLAAAYAIRAYHDAFRITGDRRWLRNAVYWAETGVPFIYLWSLPDKPMMLGATIPVFGSTFYTHSWLGMPVQWCGLVYAYHVFHLAQELEKAREDARPPGALNFSPTDWKRIVELITVSAMHQQFADGDKIGAYPDSITRFEQRNPAFLNPEDILVNVLGLKGHDPDIKTERLGPVVISSAANVQRVQNRGPILRFYLEWFQNEFSHTLIKGFKPLTVKADGTFLHQSKDPVRREPGWWWDEKHRRVYITVRHAKRKILIEAN